MANIPPIPPTQPTPSFAGGVPPGMRLEVYRELISAATIPHEVLKQMGERQVKQHKAEKKDADRVKKLRENNKKRQGKSLEKRTRIIR